MHALQEKRPPTSPQKITKPQQGNSTQLSVQRNVHTNDFQKQSTTNNTAEDRQERSVHLQHLQKKRPPTPPRQIAKPAKGKSPKHI